MTTQQDWLSTYFGDEVADDLEKTAQAHLLVKLAEQAGLDINQLSEEEIELLAAQLLGQLEGQDVPQGGPQPGGPGGAPNPHAALGGQPGMPGMAPQGAPQGQMNPAFAQRPQMPQQGAPQAQAPQAAQATAVDMAKEAEAKFQEADALGRVMAHSYIDELEKISSARETEKTAMRIRGGDVARATGSRVKDVAGRAAGFARKHKGVAAGAAVGGGIGFVGGRASKREKTASAFEKLANDRAFQILQTLGIDPTTGQPLQPQEQQQEQDVDFGAAVDQRALQLLSEAGYDVNEVASAYDQAVGVPGGDVPQQ